MMDTLFLVAMIGYCVATALQFVGLAFKKEAVTKGAWYLALVAFATHTAYTVWRGVIAGRIPMANQFEFANATAWGCMVLLIVLKWRMRADWMASVILPMVFLAISYAALSPREITELMPALRSIWFAMHIGSAVFSYACFAIAGGAGVRYLALSGKEEKHLRALDRLSYRLICAGFLLLTVVILSGCVWAEQAWGAFWTWDPKETWALITWIIYAIYLHQRMRKGWQGKRMAWFSVVALVCVVFTFAGVNTLLPGLHSYA